MPRTQSKRNFVLTWVPTLADPAAPKASEVTGASVKDITCHVVKGQYTLGPTDSDTNDETDLCADAKGATITDPNYEFNAQVFRYFTALGVADTQDLFAAFKAYPVGYIVARYGKSVSSPLASGDKVDVFGFTIDNPRNIADEGNLKFSIKGVPTGVMKLDVAITT